MRNTPCGGLTLCQALEYEVAAALTRTSVRGAICCLGGVAARDREQTLQRNNRWPPSYPEESTINPVAPLPGGSGRKK